MLNTWENKCVILSARYHAFFLDWKTNIRENHHVTNGTERENENKGERQNFSEKIRVRRREFTKIENFSITKSGKRPFTPFGIGSLRCQDILNIVSLSIQSEQRVCILIWISAAGRPQNNGSIEMIKGVTNILEHALTDRRRELTLSLTNWCNL